MHSVDGAMYFCSFSSSLVFCCPLHSVCAVLPPSFTSVVVWCFDTPERNQLKKNLYTYSNEFSNVLFIVCLSVSFMRCCSSPDKEKINKERERKKIKPKKIKCIQTESHRCRPLSILFWWFRSFSWTIFISLNFFCFNFCLKWKETNMKSHFWVFVLKCLLSADVQRT